MTHSNLVGVGPATAAMDTLFIERGANPYDTHALVALAHSVGASVLDRLAAGDPSAKDLPIAAVAYDVNTGEVYTGYCRDHELGVRTAHAERMAHAKAEAAGADLDNLGLVVNVEPCDNCLHWMSSAGIVAVDFVLSRKQLSDAGVVKPHSTDIFALAAEGRAAGLHYPRLSKIDHPGWVAATLGLFDNVRRDPIKEVVTYQPA